MAHMTTPTLIAHRTRHKFLHVGHVSTFSTPFNTLYRYTWTSYSNLQTCFTKCYHFIGTLNPRHAPVIFGPHNGSSRISIHCFPERFWTRTDSFRTWEEYIKNILKAPVKRPSRKTGECRCLGKTLAIICSVVF